MTYCPGVPIKPPCKRWILFWEGESPSSHFSATPLLFSRPEVIKLERKNDQKWNLYPGHSRQACTFGSDPTIAPPRQPCSASSPNNFIIFRFGEPSSSEWATQSVKSKKEIMAIMVTAVAGALGKPPGWFNRPLIVPPVQKGIRLWRDAGSVPRKAYPICVGTKGKTALWNSQQTSREVIIIYLLRTSKE